MKTIHEIKNELHKLRFQLKNFDDLQHNFIFNSDNPEEDLLAKKINGCLDLAGDLERQIQQLSKEILTEGKLVLNMNGRYEINGFELTSGATIEIWNEHYQEWSEDRIEHFDGSYGLYYKKTNNLDGLKARVRQS